MENFVALPSDVKVALTAIVLWLVAKGFDALINALPWLEFVRGYAEQLGYALALIIVAVVEQALPSQYPDLSVLAVRLLIELLAAVGVGKVLTGAKRAIYG